MNQNLKRSGLVIFSFGLLSLYGFNCSKNSFEATSSQEFASQIATQFQPDPGVVPTETKLTGYSVLTSEEVFESFTQLTGIQIPDSVTTSFYKNRSSSLPESPDLGSVSAPLLLNITNIASQFCSQLYDQEKDKDPGDRLYFQSLDFTKGPNQLNDGLLSELVRKFARNFWGRNEKEDELIAFKDYLHEYMASLSTSESTAVTGTKPLVTTLCTASLASLEAITY